MSASGFLHERNLVWQALGALWRGLSHGLDHPAICLIAVVSAAVFAVLSAILGLPSRAALHRANARLRQQEAKASELNRALGLAEQIAHVGHWRVSLPSYAISWSDEVYRIYGVSKEHHVPTIDNAVAAYHPADVAVVQATFQKAIDTKDGFEFHARLVRPNGEVRHVVSRGIAQADPDGVVTAIFGVFLDLTDQKLIEARLQRANRDAATANRALQTLALQDSLTGLANRRRFDADLEQEFRRAHRNRQPLALIMLDADHFKLFNDLYGHLAGDACLRAIAGVLGAMPNRAGDLAVRYGGEEFAVLMPDTDEAGAARVATQLLLAIRDLALPHAGSAEGFVTVSAGVASLMPLPGVHLPQDLFVAADRALYRAKNSGRFQVRRATSPEADMEAGAA